MIALTQQTEADRLRELVVHARDGSPIALEAVRALVRKQLLKAPPPMLLDMAGRLLDLREDCEL